MGYTWLRLFGTCLLVWLGLFIYTAQNDRHNYNWFDLIMGTLEEAFLVGTVVAGVGVVWTL